ncbi:MAG: Lrp/AsnC family transcriptional regulator [Bacillota bacterium]|uniref:Lrp/AsnC family transcriptional regulator n=1 Tax=Desulfurispora thermophila TaxID=265470 RepID=UPI00037AF6ED|nr:Lrp/AsnC family transcriptional regulator [Desulfurispora thermophila]
MPVPSKSVDKEILAILEENARISLPEIAFMLNMDVEEVARRVRELEERKVITGYLTLVNWEKVGEERVCAFIEVRTQPQRDVGYDAVAERISRFSEVRSVRLMSGAYDLAVIVEGRNMREVSNFVATRLATIEGVVSTTTHFVLKTYKQDGVIFENEEEDRRLVISP